MGLMCLELRGSMVLSRSRSLDIMDLHDDVDLIVMVMDLLNNSLLGLGTASEPEPTPLLFENGPVDLFGTF